MPAHPRYFAGPALFFWNNAHYYLLPSTILKRHAEWLAV